MTTKIELNKDLSVDYTEWKKNITSKGYSLQRTGIRRTVRYIEDTAETEPEPAF